MKRVLAIALGLTAMAAPAQPVHDPAPRLRAIAMETSSWGRPVSNWTIDAHGTGRYTRSEPNAHSPQAIVTRGFAAGTAGFRRLRVLLGRAESRAGADLPCGQRITDQEYGQVRWTRFNGREAALGFDMGCRDPRTRRLLTDISRAEALVAGWAANEPIFETRKVHP